jgi:hypothetical protein
MPRTRTMYLHTFDEKPASYCDMHGSQFLVFAGARHRSRAATLVPSLAQIHREQRRCLASDWREWLATKPEHRRDKPRDTRYGYVLVEVPI